MSAIHFLNKGHSAAGASKSREILFDNLMSDKAEAMLLRLQVRLMSERLSGGQCSTYVTLNVLSRLGPLTISRLWNAKFGKHNCAK